MKAILIVMVCINSVFVIDYIRYRFSKRYKMQQKYFWNRIEILRRQGKTESEIYVYFRNKYGLETPIVRSDEK
jgi:hypothetical protein